MRQRGGGKQQPHVFLNQKVGVVLAHKPRCSVARKVLDGMEIEPEADHERSVELPELEPHQRRANTVIFRDMPVIPAATKRDM